MRLPKALLVGEIEADFAPVRDLLQEHECECLFASSYADGLALLSKVRFDLVLCSGQPGIKVLFPSVVSAEASLFCAHAIEDGCMWVPVILEGKDCLGSPILRPPEFAEKIREIMDAIHPHRQSPAAAHGSFWRE